MRCIQGILYMRRRISDEMILNSNYMLITSAQNEPKFVFIGSIKREDISDDENRTTKKDKAGHGFGVHNIRTAAANYGGELMSECKETPYGYDFILEMIFPVG